MSIPTFPTLVTRAQKGAPLSDAEMDANWANLRAYSLTLANLISSSLNADGTLAANSVDTASLQAASVTLAALNPALLYSIVPVDTDSGTVNAYAITARGRLGGSNLVPAGSTYDANGNFVVSNLTLNYGYYWTKTSGSDTGCVPTNQNALTASGSFTAGAATVTLTGTPNAVIQATLIQAAPISAYKNGQMFFIYTNNANTGPATNNVSNLGAIPILQNGKALQAGAIPAQSVFAVVYLNGSFTLFSGGGSSSSTSGGSSNVNYTFSGINVFSTGQVALPGASASFAANHGFGVVPTSVNIVLRKIAADATTVAVGEYVPAGAFQIAGAPAFVTNYDSGSVTVTQGASATPTLGGTAITAASWVLIVNASEEVATSNTVFPALTYLSTRPQGAFSYGNSLLIFNQGAGTGACYVNAVNLTTNLVTPMSVPNNPIANLNGAPFTRASGQVQAIFTSNYGIYFVPLVNPNQNIIPAAQLYGASGVIANAITITASTAYILTPGNNEISYSLDGTTYVSFSGGAPVNIPNTNLSTTLWLKGNPNATVTANLSLSSATWGATDVNITTALGGDLTNYKPVWMLESGGTITDVYVVASNYGASYLVNNIAMYHMTAASGAVLVGTLDFTNSGIANIAAFNNAGFGSSARVMFFQYNAITKRIYIMTNQSGFIHIFQITGSSNDITALWTSGTYYSSLAYVKSIAVGGDGAPYGSTGSANGSPENLYIEVNQNTGSEVAIVIPRYGNINLTGSVTRIPWNE